MSVNVGYSAHRSPAAAVYVTAPERPCARDVEQVRVVCGVALCCRGFGGGPFHRPARNPQLTSLINISIVPVVCSRNLLYKISLYILGDL